MNHYEIPTDYDSNFNMHISCYSEDVTEYTVHSTKLTLFISDINRHY